MQIFWPEKTYGLSAQALDDKRLNKQIIELGQIISTAMWLEDCSIAETLCSKGLLYLPTHENHPVVKGCKTYFVASQDYLTDLIMEYAFRFDQIYRVNVAYCKSYSLFKTYTQTGFQNHTPNHKHIKDVNEAYRKCLIEKWTTDKTPPKWTKRNKPNWAKESLTKQKNCDSVLPKGA